MHFLQAEKSMNKQGSFKRQKNLLIEVAFHLEGPNFIQNEWHLGI